MPSAETRPTERTTCVIAGGGPAGMVLGLLLARAGVEVTVLEKHADFLRDFRGDTVHPSTLSLIDDLGLMEPFAQLPQSHFSRARIEHPQRGEVVVADFTRLPVRYPYVAMVPQWHLLDLLADAARQEPTFDLRMEHEVTGLVRAGDRVVGVEYLDSSGTTPRPGRLRADLVVACDGRTSVLRAASGLHTTEFDVDFDVWWFRLPTEEPVEALIPRVGAGHVLIPLPREGYVQGAYLGRKGTDADLRARGIEAFRADVAGLMPEAAGSVDALSSFDDVKLLDVRLDRLRRWHTPGLLCIGDAAHAMSPVGGVGINLAIQDAVGAARLLADHLRATQAFGAEPGREERVLRGVRRRRIVPTVVTQSLQRALHVQLIDRVLAGRITEFPTAVVAALQGVPALSAVPAAVMGIGVRPERAPAWARRSSTRGRTPVPS